MLNLLTLVLVSITDTVVWGVFAGPEHMLMHAPFALPILIGGAEAGSEPMADNTFRFLAAIWVGAGVGFFTCAWRYRTETTLFRVLMAALFLGGIGRSMGLLHYPATTLLIALIVLELVPPLFLVPMQAALARRVEA